VHKEEISRNQDAEEDSQQNESERTIRISQLSERTKDIESAELITQTANTHADTHTHTHTQTHTLILTAMKSWRTRGRNDGERRGRQPETIQIMAITERYRHTCIQ